MLDCITGTCHCGNLSFELRTDIAPESIRPRACDCSFCRMHGARNWSDPKGTAVIRVSDERHLHRYRFALRTADFYICRICGAYLGAVLTDEGRTWSTLNLRLSPLSVGGDGVSYGGEDEAARVERRKRVWTPTAIMVGR